MYGQTDDQRDSYILPPSSQKYLFAELYNKNHSVLQLQTNFYLFIVFFIFFVSIIYTRLFGMENRCTVATQIIITNTPDNHKSRLPKLHTFRKKHDSSHLHKNGHVLP